MIAIVGPRCRLSPTRLRDCKPRTQATSFALSVPDVCVRAHKNVIILPLMPVMLCRLSFSSLRDSTFLQHRVQSFIVRLAIVAIGCVRGTHAWKHIAVVMCVVNRFDCVPAAISCYSVPYAHDVVIVETMYAKLALGFSVSQRFPCI